MAEMTMVETLLDELEHHGLDAEAAQRYWDPFVALFHQQRNLPVQIPQNTIEGLQRRLRECLMEAPEQRAEAKLAADELAAAIRKTRQARKKRQEWSKALANARLEAVRRTRILLIDAIETAGKQMDSIAAEHAVEGYLAAEFLPERVVELYRQAQWAACWLTTSPLDVHSTLIETGKRTRIVVSVFRYVRHELRPAVEWRCLNIRAQGRSTQSGGRWGARG